MNRDDAREYVGGPPRRWLEGGAPAGVAMLLQNAPKPRPRTAVDVQRTTALVAKIGMKPVAAGFLHGLLGKTLVAVALGTVAVGTTTVALRTRSTPTPEPSAVVVPTQAPITNANVPPTAINALPPLQEPAPSVAMPVAPSLVADPFLTPAKLRPSARAQVPDVDVKSPAAPLSAAVSAPPAPAAPTAEPDASSSRAASRIAEEARILESARALLASNPTAALREVEAHASTFPQGALRTERELLRIEALVRAGRKEEAQNLRIAFLAQNASVAHTRKLRSIFGEVDSNP